MVLSFEPLDVPEVFAELSDETLHRHHDPVVRIRCDRSRLRAPVLPAPDPEKAPFAYRQAPSVTELHGRRGGDGLPMVTVSRDMRPACRLLDGLCLHPEEPVCAACLKGIVRMIRGCDHRETEVVSGLVRCRVCLDVLDVVEEDDPTEGESDLEVDVHDTRTSLRWSEWRDRTELYLFLKGAGRRRKAWMCSDGGEEA